MLPALHMDGACFADGWSANRVIAALFAAKKLPAEVGPKYIKAKKKAGQHAKQRELFVKHLTAKPGGLEEARKLLKAEEGKRKANKAVEAEDAKELANAGDIPMNVMARVAHLMVDPRTINVVIAIFRGPDEKAAARELLDNKSTRTIELWRELCDKYFNNEEWAPQNEQDDSRVSDIDPSKPPSESYAPEKLRALFSSMRSKYTVYYARHHKSGHLAEGHGEGADNFADFVRGEMIYLYMYLVLGTNVNLSLSSWK